MTDSNTLLSQYARTGSESAFLELVSRYIDLVYSTAFRLVDGDVESAQDVAQTVFVALADQARTLPKDVMLGGWLHLRTRFAAGKLMRSERRRRLRERQAAEMNAIEDHSESNLAQVAPVLDEAIAPRFCCGSSSGKTSVAWATRWAAVRTRPGSVWTAP
jgi:DNA-directed RNA polymerase specialized sigma24 family protein